MENKTENEKKSIIKEQLDAGLKKLAENDLLLDFVEHASKDSYNKGYRAASVNYQTGLWITMGLYIALLGVLIYSNL